MEAKEPGAKKTAQNRKVGEEEFLKKIRDETGHEQWDKTTSAQSEKTE